MTTVVNQITSKHGAGSILPIFITCDPARDDVKAVKAYCKDFHPTLVGLTGSYNDIKKTCKTFRVYFSTPPDAKPQDDYLVDHSILSVSGVSSFFRKLTWPALPNPASTSWILQVNS